MKTKISCFLLIFTLMIAPVYSYVQQNAIVPILLYHCIEENYSDDISHLAITKEDFREHMQALKDSGYTPISFKEYSDFIEYNTPLPAKPIIITFDDGYLSNYQYAYPILKEFGFKATFFIVVSTVGKTDEIAYPHFNWEQASEMEQSGLIEIGSHTYYHKDLRTLPKDKLELDLRLSKYLIDTNLNKDCKLIAFPYGYYNEEVQRRTARAGYSIQCIVGDKGANTITTPLNQLKRLTVNGNLSPTELLEYINANIQKEIYH